MSRASNWQSHSGVSLRGGKTTAPLCSATHPQLSPLAKHLIDIVILREGGTAVPLEGRLATSMTLANEKEGGQVGDRIEGDNQNTIQAPVVPPPND